MVSLKQRGRRWHTKSRNGCQRCKVRKVKCDETRPDCLNCRRLELQCTFKGPDSASPQSSPTLSLRRRESSDNTRIVDMRLLHYYITFACATVLCTDDQRIMDYWAKSVPAMAFENDFLLDALLSAAALHLSAQSPGDEQMSQTSRRYYSSAVPKLRCALSSIGPDTAEPLCATAVFTMLLAFTLSRTALANEPYKPPAAWFRNINGMGALIRHARPFLQDDGVLLLIRNEHVLPGSARGTSELPQLPDLSHLLSLSNFDEPSNSCLDHASKLSRLEFWQSVTEAFVSAQAGASRDNVRHLLLGAASVLDLNSLRLIEEEDVVTMVILSHYFALLLWTGGNWWLQHALSWELVSLRGAIPPTYHWAAVLPKSENTWAETGVQTAL